MVVTSEHVDRVTRWGGRLLLVVAAAVAGAAGFVREYSGDFHWHVTLGDWTRRHGEIYRLDTLSFTFAGQPMFASAWLSDVLLSLLFRSGGYPLAFAARAACLLGALALVMREGRRQATPPIVTAALALLAFAETWPQLYLRPEMFSLPCLAATLHLLGEHERTGRRLAVAAALGVVALWGNLHGSLAIGMLAFGLYGAERAVRGAIAHDRRRVVEGLAMPLLVYLASSVNAEGFRMVLAFVTLGGGCADQNEWHPLRLSMIGAPGALLLAASAVAVVAATPRVSAWRALLLVAMMVNTLQHRRFLLPTLFIAIFVAVAHTGPVAARVRALLATAQVRGLIVLGAALAASAAALLELRDGGFHRSIGLGEEPGVYPGAACAYVIERRLGGRVINTYGIGGYLAFCLDGRAKVAIDQRACSLYPGDYYQAYKARLKTTPGMVGTFDELQADWAFVERGPAARALAGAPDRFALLWVDDVVAVYADRTRVTLAPDEVLRELEPERLVRIARGEGDLDRAERELDLLRARCPDCRASRKAELAVALGRRDRARYEAAARLAPQEESAWRTFARERLGVTTPPR